MSSATRSAAPDQAERDRALDTARSVLVQAPAGSGKTTLLAERFLRLLATVDEPGQVVAITFTNAAAAEMRNRILDRLRAPEPDELAERVLERSTLLGWRLLDVPAQMRIATIDSFCRDLALQEPLLSGLGSGLGIDEQPRELYLRAARRTLARIDLASDGRARGLSAAIEALLLWRDNNWHELEQQLVEMLDKRDQWMQGFVLNQEPDEAELEALQQRLERPFAEEARRRLTVLDGMMDAAACAEARDLARFAFSQGFVSYQGLAELEAIPRAPFPDSSTLDEAHEAYLALASMTLKTDGAFRKSVDAKIGFPAANKTENARMKRLIAHLAGVEGLNSALHAVRTLPPLRYTEDEWLIVRSCFRLLAHAAGELKVVFAEAGAVDFIEVAQIAGRVLESEDGLPTDAAQAVADGIRHLLVDEFQDTSRRQHRLLARLIAAWPDAAGRTLFVVGDPMQSIYGFRDAEAELFARVREHGLEIGDAAPLRLDPVRLQANFRSAPRLVTELNSVFEGVFGANDGGGVTFEAATPARTAIGGKIDLHMGFVPRAQGGTGSEAKAARELARAEQTAEIVELVRGMLPRVDAARQCGEKFRIAVLGRTRGALARVATALREGAIPFRAVELEELAERPEVLDALAMARALANPADRVAWLGLLRAPWCGLALDALHRLTSADNAELLRRPVAEVAAERAHLLAAQDRRAVERLVAVMREAWAMRAAHPAQSLGTWLESVWLRLGGARCVDAAGRANVDLLWSCLDRLPEGDADICGPALNAALDKLMALGDPQVSVDAGVQLMTIHKSKGLEFEVVIVPELQARGRGDEHTMLAWLERGLTQDDDSGAVTEFLVAPFQAKGAQRGNAKAWVSRVKHERDRQEMRRLLYVAATRAREELHLFARAECKTANGAMELAMPDESLLRTAWPGVESEIRSQFDEWCAAQAAQPDGAADFSQVVQAIAAGGTGNLLVMEAPRKPTMLRRLPADLLLREPLRSATGARGITGLDRKDEAALYARHRGGLVSRALGTGVHALLEELARLRSTLNRDAACFRLAAMEPRIQAMVRAAGVERAEANRIAAEAMRIALEAAREPVAGWILHPHPGAQSEAEWAGVMGGGLRSVRVDRVFQAGATPLTEGANCWWIIDYKTAHGDGSDPEGTLPELRRLFAPQVEAYATVLRHLHGDDASVRCGLYYPRMKRLDWWEA